MDPSRYDRTQELSAAEREALAEFVEALEAGANMRVPAALARLKRLMVPVADVCDLMGSHREARKCTRGALAREMHRRGTPYWAWTEEQWSQTLKGEGSAWPSDYYKSASRRPLMAVAYLLCGYRDLYSTGHFKVSIFAEKVFGRERVESACRTIRDELSGWGCGAWVLDGSLERMVCHVMLANGSPLLEDLTTQKLTEMRDRRVPKSLHPNLYAMSRALAARGLIAAPLSVPRDTYPLERRPVDDCPEEWASWCERWRRTSTLTPNVRTITYGRLLQIGRWLARSHPQVTGPEQWTYQLAAEYVAAVCKLTVGEWSDPTRMKPEKVGRPMRPWTKENQLHVARAFFRDLQEWGWISRRFDPRRAFRAPRSLKTLLEPDPRTIADEVWAKLLWAGLNLTAQDIPLVGYARPGVKGQPFYPLEMVRAAAMVWLFAGLRHDEIRRLRVGCVRRQRGDVTVHPTGETLPEDAVCWLDVPANKTSEGKPKPVDPLVGKAIEDWEKVRPDQPAQPDAKTAEEVHYLFSYRGRRIGKAYVNHTLIPLLCRKAGVPVEDARGKITSHRARSTIASQLLNAKEPMDFFAVSEWLGHKDPSSTRHYAKVAPTRLAKSYSDAGYFGRNLRMIEVLIDQEAIRTGAAASGEPWKFYDLGHGYCTYDFFQQCPHRMACARCSFYLPKDSTKAQLLEGKANLSRMREEIPLTDEEVAAVEEGIELHEKLLERLADVPTPEGPTPRELGIVIPLSRKPDPER